MEIQKIDLGSKISYVNLYPIADIHIGSKHFQEKLFLEHINKIKNDKNGVVILNGDLINNAIKNSVSDIYSERLTPEEALEKLVLWLTPIKDKIIGATTGNHEWRTYKETGIDIVKHLCYRLGIADRYDPISNVIFLSFGKNRNRENVRNTFVIYHTHGSGGGRTTGAKANKVKNLSSIIHADVYIHSHTHLPMVMKEDFIMTNVSNKGIKQVSRLFVNTNSNEGFGGYGERLGFAPANLEYITIKLTADNDGNKFKVAEL